MLRESNNVIAENLARQVALREGQPASFSGAAAAVTAAARRLGVPGGIRLVDGSGLSPQDRIAPAALVRLVSLASAGAQGRLRAAITGLPVAGFSGTLAPGGSVFSGFSATVPRPGPGQDRQPEQRGHAGGPGLRRQRTAAGLRVHDRPGAARGPGQRRGRRSTGWPPRWPAAAAGAGEPRPGRPPWLRRARTVEG